jgi:hypothetical protein
VAGRRCGLQRKLEAEGNDPVRYAGDEDPAHGRRQLLCHDEPELAVVGKRLSGVGHLEAGVDRHHDR